MNTKLAGALAMMTFATLLSRGATASAPCCAVPTLAPAPSSSCCAVEQGGTGAVMPLTARSLYQLNATWTNDAGSNVVLSSLRGRPIVLAMFFAQCEYACPLLVQDMQRARAALAPEVRPTVQLVLVSFDTARDTPAALKAYRERMALDAGWTLLWGDAGAVQELAMLLGVKFKHDARGQFAHSNLLTVLNREGEIVHQHAGLNGDISEVARRVAVAAK
jgi:protein SCO1